MGESPAAPVPALPRFDHLVERNAGQECKGLKFLVKDDDQSW